MKFTLELNLDIYLVISINSVFYRIFKKRFLSSLFECFVVVKAQFLNESKGIRKKAVPAALTSVSPSLDEIIFQDIKTAHHLGEDKYFVAACNQLRE